METDNSMNGKKMWKEVVESWSTRPSASASYQPATAATALSATIAPGVARCRNRAEIRPRTTAEPSPTIGAADANWSLAQPPVPSQVHRTPAASLLAMYQTIQTCHAISRQAVARIIWP
ncbi:hypothetical protein [Streptomyces sp. NPDC006971]|uniref:hypothetical protein n=1 Tax=Streptomyces sp. NPDC006971 TaxID=3154784 RepID=UPI0033D5C20B